MALTQPRPLATKAPQTVHRRRSMLALSALLVLAAAGCRKTTGPAPATQVTSPPQQARATSETWDAVFMNGAHVGSVHTTITHEGDLAARIVKIVSDTQLTISRYGDVAKMQVIMQSLETLDGEVRSFMYQTEPGASPIVMEGRVQADHMIVTQRTTGKETNTEIPWHATQGGLFAVEGSLRRAPMQPGEQRTVSLLWPDIGGVQLATVTMEAQQFEETQLLEGSQKLLRIKQVVRLEGFSLDSLSWSDAQGEILKMTLVGPQQETYRTSRERALAAPAGTDFDIGFDTSVPVASPLPQPYETKRVVYEATLEQANPAEVFSSGASQQVEPVDPRRARITVRAIRPADPPQVTPEDPPTDADRNPNNLIQSDDERVRLLAGTTAPDVTDPWQTCVALEKWVCHGIHTKNFGQAFATAADVAQSLEGDCTEHAVLLAALCRARGIPARVCVGLVYSPPDQAFAFHMWNEVWIADRWIPMDGTKGLGGIGAAYIKLRHSNLATEQAGSAVMSVLQVMNQLQLQVVEVE